MFGNLVKSQLLENLYGVKFIITFAVCFVLVMAGTISGIAKYEAQLENKEKYQSDNKKELIDSGDWRHATNVIGQKVVKPVTPLSIFSSGLEESVGRTSTVRESDFPQMEDSIYSTAPIFAVFGDLDLTFIIKLVISLFAILFTYDLISGEKERGTLKLCLANSVPRNTFILGKSLGSFISMLIPLVIPMAFALLMMLLIGDISFTADHWLRIFWILLGYILYMMAFFSVGLFVSTITKSSATSFLILLFFWVMIVLIVPKGAMLMANQFYPVPDVNETQEELRTLKENFNRDITQALMRIYEQQQAGQQRSKMKRTDWAALWEEVRNDLEPEYYRQSVAKVNDFRLKQSNLTNLAINFSRISPASAVTYIGMNMAGTGYASQEKFLAQLMSHRTFFIEYVRAKQKEEELDDPNTASGRNQKNSSNAELPLSDLPTMTFNQISMAASVELILPDLLSMALISIIFYLLAFVMFLRYDVR
jgi:ABC-type transport system involved in multi-copper enzyme maturation permease subunit